MVGELFQEAIERGDRLRAVQDARFSDLKRAVGGLEALRGEGYAVVVKQEYRRMKFFIKDNVPEGFRDGAVGRLVAGEAGADVAVQEALAHFFKHPVELVKLHRG